MKRATEFRLRQILVILFSAFLAGVTPAGIAVSGDLAVAEGPAASGQAAEARQDDALLETTIKLEDLLGEDGTLDLDAAGNRGSIDGKGYRLASGSGEAPRFAPAAAAVPGDERWMVFQSAGVNAGVSSLAFDVSGNLYVGGDFTFAGGVAANHVAKWDGSSWSALGGGTNGWVKALAVDASGNLYAGGAFTEAGGVTVNHIAKWDGSAWTALGDGMHGTLVEVLALAVDGSGNVYAAGHFYQAGTVPANHVAKWNGSTWSALGGGMDGSVNAIAVDSRGNLYAGGSFRMAGAVTAYNVAKWNGKTWSALGRGIKRMVVRALAVDASGNLYVGGEFQQAGGVTANNIAKWDGTAWSALGSGMNNYVNALAVDASGDLYAGGAFTEAGGVTANHVAKWDGSSWSALGGWTNTTVVALAGDGSGNLYGGGYFRQIGGIDANRVARWNGSAWSALGNGLNNAAKTLAVDGSGNLYAGGEFQQAGGVASNHLAMWQGRPALAVDSTSKGLTLYRNGIWEQIQAESAYLMGPFGAKLVASIPGLGLQMYDGAAWSLLSARTDAERVIGIGTDLFVDFGSDGLYRYRNGWTRIARLNTQKLAAYGESLAFSVPGTLPQSGIYLYDGSTTKRISTKGSPQQMLGIQKKLYVDFGPSGLSCYDGTWKVLNAANPSLMTAAGTRLVASFPGSGISVYDGQKWNLISSDANAENIVATPFVIYVDRGPDGIYKYKKGWQKISSDNPDKMRLYAGKLVATFPGKGLYLFDEGQWTRLSTADDIQSMLGLIFE